MGCRGGSAIPASVEVRWFRRGPIPDELLAWLKSGEGEVRLEETREDAYLFLPDEAAIGVKLRQGLIEVKRREAELGLTSWGTLAGRTARWRKWSVAVTETAADPHRVLVDSHWVHVKKDRYLRKSSAELAGATTRDQPSVRVVPVPPQARPQDGCTVEVARLAV